MAAVGAMDFGVPQSHVFAFKPDAFDGGAFVRDGRQDKFIPLSKTKLALWCGHGEGPDRSIDLSGVAIAGRHGHDQRSFLGSGFAVEKAVPLDFCAAGDGGWI